MVPVDEEPMVSSSIMISVFCEAYELRRIMPIPAILLKALLSRVMGTGASGADEADIIDGGAVGVRLLQMSLGEKPVPVESKYGFPIDRALVVR